MAYRKADFCRAEKKEREVLTEGIVSTETVQMLRNSLSRLEESVTVRCEDGIRYTFCRPGNAVGCLFDEGRIHMNYVATMKANGARRAQYGFMWPVEQWIYGQQRRRIIAELLSGLYKAPFLPRDEEHAENDTAPFIEDFGRALQRLRAGDKKPKPEGKAKLQIKCISGAWWLFHRQWTPLCFESFEEAALFAKKYVVKPAAKVLQPQ